MDSNTLDLIQRFWDTMNTNDFAAVGDLLHDDFMLEWPQSGERLVGRERFTSVNQNYPSAGVWSFTINRLVAGENGGASDVTVTDGKRTDRSAAFFEARGGRIWRIVEYWPEPFPPASWRKQWVEEG